jgi:hypothetical protein
MIRSVGRGTTRTAASKIVKNGFRAGADDAVFFAEEFATAREFAQLAAIERGATGATVLRLQVPTSMAKQLQRGVIGEFRGAPFVDIAGGTGFEQVLVGSGRGAFNAAIKSGMVRIERIPVGAF